MQFTHGRNCYLLTAHRFSVSRISTALIHGLSIEKSDPGELACYPPVIRLNENQYTTDCTSLLKFNLQFILYVTLLEHVI